MIDLYRFGTHPFDDEDISREELGRYSIEHLSRMSGDTAGGQLDAEVALSWTLARERTPGQRPDTSQPRTRRALAPLDQPASGTYAYHGDQPGTMHLPGVDPGTSRNIGQAPRLTSVAIRVAESYRASAHQFTLVAILGEPNLTPRGPAAKGRVIPEKKLVTSTAKRG